MAWSVLSQVELNGDDIVGERLDIEDEENKSGGAARSCAGEKGGRGKRWEGDVGSWARRLLPACSLLGGWLAFFCA